MPMSRCTDTKLQFRCSYVLMLTIHWCAQALARISLRNFEKLTEMWRDEKKTNNIISNSSSIKLYAMSEDRGDLRCDNDDVGKQKPKEIQIVLREKKMLMATLNASVSCACLIIMWADIFFIRVCRCLFYARDQHSVCDVFVFLRYSFQIRLPAH